MLTKKLALGAVAAACMFGATVTPAGAGGEMAALSVTPNPATTAQEITIANAPGEDNTCEIPISLPNGAAPQGPLSPLSVYVEVFGPGDEMVAEESVVPDAGGNWSVTVGPFATEGSYRAEASCEYAFIGKLAAPARAASFDYASVVFTVTGVPVTSPTTAAPSSSTTAAAAAATTTPTFTG